MTMTASRYASCSPALAVLAAVLLAGPAAAQTPQPAAPAAEATAPEAKARITKRDCRRLLRHQPSGDVAYKPGVDARGKAVAPADLSGGFKMVLPDVFEFNVTKDLTAYLGGAKEQLEADKAAALAAEKSAAATDAAVSSAALSLSGAQDAYTTAAAAADAATAAAAAAPGDAALAAAAESATATAATAQSNLTATQTYYTATENAASANDVSAALTAANAAKTAAEAAGYTPDATAQSAATTASTAASASSAADTAALAARETVAKSEGMELNVGTVRYNINTGAMTFNGQPLNDAAMGEMAVICKEILSGKK
jgi:hypothetical protein